MTKELEGTGDLPLRSGGPITTRAANENPYARPKYVSNGKRRTNPLSPILPPV
jgi:hypothetical protein